jgi:hypothetical protein
MVPDTPTPDALLSQAEAIAQEILERRDALSRNHADLNDHEVIEARCALAMLEEEFASIGALLGSEMDLALGRSSERGNWHLEPAELVAPGLAVQRGSGDSGGYHVKFTALKVQPGGKWPAVLYGRARIGSLTRATISGGRLPGEVDIVLDVTESDAPRLFVRELTLRSPAPITTVALRSLSIPELLRVALAVIHPYPEAPPIATPQRSQRGRGRILDDAQLADVARIYRENRGRGFVAVAEHFNIGRSTAGDYIKRAKAAGHLVEED